MKNSKTMVFLNSRYKNQFLNSEFTILIQGNFTFQSSEFNFLFTRAAMKKIWAHTVFLQQLSTL